MEFTESLGLDFPLGHEGKSHYEFEVQENHLNTKGVLHGGMCSTLVDMGIARAIRSVVPADKDIMTIALNVSFLAGCKEGLVTVTGRATHVGKSLATGEAEVRLGDRVLARGTGTWFIAQRRGDATKE